MKTKLISLVSLLLFFSASYSQSFTVGIKGGVSINKITGKSFKEQFTYGYHVGGYATLGLSKKFAIQPEVLFSQLSTDTSSQFSSIYQFNHINNIKLSYLSIPIVLNYNVSNLLALQVGPQFGVLINQDKNLLQNGGEAFKKGDFAMLGGLQLKLLKFRVYGRYVIGLNNLDNIGNKDDWKSQSIQLGVGINL
ncbi:MAG: outer membrane beta-barrel protein [Ginsengibacter sp.]